MHVRAILFDLDGTLIDSYIDIGLHLNRTLKDFSIEVEKKGASATIKVIY